ncbi:hypothetical protein [Pseudonocardia acaciae]|nr:hypothetical protein [Pseudonocardia acaciae]
MTTTNDTFCDVCEQDKHPAEIAVTGQVRVCWDCVEDAEIGAEAGEV